MTTGNTPTRAAALGILAAFLETVREAGPDGAPSGPMYLAAMTIGLDLAAYQSIMEALVVARLVREENHVYYAINAG